MKLLLRREQKSGLMGKMSFILGVRDELTDVERSNTAKYRLGTTVRYSREHITDPGSGLLGLASRLAFKAMNISVSVDDLANGKRIECKDIVEMLAVEDQLKEAYRSIFLSVEIKARSEGNSSR